MFTHPIYTSLHMLIPDSQSFPPLPPFLLGSPTSLFSMSVSLFLFHKYVHLCHILDSTYKWYLMVFVFLFLSYISMIISRSSMLLQMALFHSFLWLIFHCVYIHHIFFIHSSVDGHLGCFHVLAIVKSAAVNIGVHVSFQIIVFSGYIPRSGVAG